MNNALIIIAEVPTSAGTSIPLRGRTCIAKEKPRIALYGLNEKIGVMEIMAVD
jgi:hypothetical protein